MCLFSFGLHAGSGVIGALTVPHESEQLSQKEVRTLIKDSYGYIWVGTQDGLNRFDGYTYSKFSRDPFDTTSLQYDIIDHLFEDNFKQLWIGTRAGLDIMDLNTLNIRHIKSIPGIEEPITRITGVRKANSTLMLGFEKKIFNVYSDDYGGIMKGELLYEIPADDQNEILTFKPAHNDIWVVTSKELRLLNSQKKEPSFLHTWESNQVRQVFPIGKKKALALDGEKFFLIDHGKIIYLDLPVIGKNIRSILIDEDSNELYLGTKGFGLYKAQYRDTPFTIFNLQKVFVESIDDQRVTIQRLYKSEEKNEDLIWCGTRSHGLYHYSRSKNLFTHILPFLKAQFNFSGNVYSILPENNITWIGTDQGVFSLENNVAKKIVLRSNGHSDATVYSLTRTKKGDLIAATNIGIFVKKKGSPEFSPIEHQMESSTLALEELYNGNIWAGTSRGLYCFDENYRLLQIIRNFETANDTVKINTIGSILEDTKKRIWIGTIKGLFLLPGESQKAIYASYKVTESNGPIDDFINSVYEDSNGDIWVSSSKGISKVIRIGEELEFVHYTQRDGLSNPFVYGIIESADHRLWMSTNQGLSVLDPLTKSFQNYSAEDGLINDEFNSGAFAKDNRGKIYFGGIEVLVSINDGIPENQHLPPVVLRDVRIDGISKFSGPKQKEIIVPPSSKALSLVVAALDFTNPLKNQYAYRIISLDKNWINNGTNREINLFNLPYGRHKIEIKASNNQNQWNEDEPLILEINVLAPWYKSKVWYLTLLGFLFLGIWGVHEYRVNEKIHIERVKAEENERVRKMASQDLHDEFGNSLTRISVLTELIKNKISKGESEAVKSDLEKIAENTGRLYQGTKDFIWSIRMDSDLLFESAIRIKDYADDMMSAQDIVFETLGIEQDLKSVHLPQGSSRQIVVIFKEAIANTLKHSKADKAQLEVTILSQNYAQLRWSDNGVGLKNVTNAQGNGLQNMKSRAKMIGADLRIHGENGTEIILIIPIIKKNGK